MILRAHAVLSAISRRYSSLEGRSPMCYSPVRHSLAPKSESVRLACVRHAASVYPEPGSNSPSKDVSTLLAWSSGNAQWVRCDPGQAAVQLLSILGCSQMYRFLPTTLGGEAGTKQEIARNCLLVRGARRVQWCVLRLDQETVAVLLSTLQLLRSL